ncbi:MAG: hypothetical protein ACRYFS_11920 [Janthinobacterium lividum]
MPNLPNRVGSLVAYFIPGVLAAASLLGQPVVRAQAPNVPVPLTVVQGTAKTVGGKPLAGATLYLRELPGSQGWPPGIQDQETVVTDAQGHFAWTVPKELTQEFSMEVPLDTSAPECYLLPLAAGWKATVSLAQSYRNANADMGRRDLLEKATRKCETHWIKTGKNPEMTVVAPETGLVTLKLRGPSGQSLAMQTVQIVVPGTFTDYEGGVVYEGQTDAAGRIQLPHYPGLLQLIVSVPGIGFGSTGMFELLKDSDVSPALPPLAPFARLSGSLAPALVKPGAYVHLEDYGPGDHSWYDPQALVDPYGRFTLDGVLPGQHRLVLVGGQTEVQAAEVTVHPGEEVTGLVLKPKVIDPANARFNVSPDPAAQAQAAKPMVRGRVTDTAGQPVAGADVYAVCSYDNGMRGMQDTLTAKTGTDGGYVITGLPVGQGGPSVSMIAVKAGYPVAVATAQTDQPVTGAAPNLATSFQSDLVLPDGHPSLTIQVLQDGKPLAGASVHLSPESGPGQSNGFSFMFRPSGHGPARQRANECLSPSGITDAGGEVRFRDLTPGLWDVSAFLGIQQMGIFGNSGTGWSGSSQGISVSTGPPRRFILSVHQSPADAALRVLAPDGQPSADPSVSFQFGLAVYPNGSGTSLTLDKEGNGHFSLTEPGLWRVVTRFRDTALDSMPASTEPFYEGSALLAVSPALPPSMPVLIRTAKREPGHIQVRLIDKAGRPAAGAVSAGDPFDPFGGSKYAASLGANGETVFSGMPSGSYLLRANFKKPAALPLLGHDGGAFPPDAALTGVSLLVPQTAVVKANAETLITFRPQLQGYIRGKVIASDSPTNYAVYPEGYFEMRPVFDYNKKTGEFVAGPFSPGKTTLRVQKVTQGNADYASNGEDFPVDIPAGKVLPVTLTLALSAPSVPLHDRPLTGRVFLPDGKTPAWGARVALLVPETEPPVKMALTDALGQLTIADYWNSDGIPQQPSPGSPAEAVLVAWLPGSNGAVIVPANAEMDARLVLPPAVEVSGRVTVGGASVLGTPSSFRVLAAYQGRGKLNRLLNVDTTAQSDGTFVLSGLTPGTYRVQGARDGLWLSQSQTLVVTDSSLPPLTLDIAPPGTPMLLHLTNAAGQALPERIVTLNRPAGPLTDLLWPRTATADTHGDLWLDGLEAGPQMIDGTAAFTVPPLSGAASRIAVTRTVILARQALGKE